MTYDELKAKMHAKAVSTPAAGSNTGDGTMSKPIAIHTAPVETWTITCTTLGGAGAAIFSVTGSVSGLQDNAATSDLMYISDDGKVRFLITAGGTDWATSDEYTFSVSDNVAGVTGSTVIRELRFKIHSQADSVRVERDPDNDAVRVIQVT